MRLEQRKIKQEEKLKRKADKALAGEEDSDKAKRKAANTKDGGEESDSSLDLNSQSEDSDKMDDADADALNAQFVEKDPKVRTAVRNLRQREDTAKYLRNLDPNSAHYDGKSRIMKENPNPHLRESDQLFKGDNFVKFSGEALSVMQHEAFMINANEALKNKPGAQTSGPV